MTMRMTEADLRQRWSQGRPAHGVWSLLPGAVTADLLAGTDADYVVLDLQHGALSEADLPGVTAAVAAAGAVPLVRTRSAQFADIGRPLDLGARGVLVPNVRGADHVREVVAACRYGPSGNRSIGRLSGGADEPLVLIVLETATALDELDAVLAVDGLDGIYVGPSDLSLSLGRAGGEHREFMREVIASIVARAVAAGMPVGVHAAGGVDAARHAEQGATIVTAAVDTTVLSDGVRDQLRAVRAAGTPGDDHVSRGGPGDGRQPGGAP
jgi:4-hydroxy-2-oxoheptanedioate aldolase